MNISNQSPNKRRFKKFLLSPQGFGYTLRRYYVDCFLESQIKKFPKKFKILDLGGEKVNYRGRFRININKIIVKYVNQDPKSNPDYIADIASMPIKNNQYDGFILTEVLEHVMDPKMVIQEAYRILKKGGIGIITTPFHYPLHADPTDYYRYSDQYYKQVLKDIGFKLIYLEFQGTWFAVLADMIKSWFYYQVSKPHFNLLKFKIFTFIQILIVKFLLSFENKKSKTSKFYDKFTTGFALVVQK